MSDFVIKRIIELAIILMISVGGYCAFMGIDVQYTTNARVVGIQYQNNTLVLASGSRNKISYRVVPSDKIYSYNINDKIQMAVEITKADRVFGYLVMFIFIGLVVIFRLCL
jgi:hypothetical protein